MQFYDRLVRPPVNHLLSGELLESNILSYFSNQTNSLDWFAQNLSLVATFRDLLK